jgi:hypothetical protein
MGDTAATTAIEAVAQCPSTSETSPLVTAMVIGTMHTLGTNGAMIVTVRATETIEAVTTTIGIMTVTATMVGIATIPDKHPIPS